MSQAYLLWVLYNMDGMSVFRHGRFKSETCCTRRTGSFFLLMLFSTEANHRDRFEARCSLAEFSAYLNDTLIKKLHFFPTKATLLPAAMLLS